MTGIEASSSKLYSSASPVDIENQIAIDIRTPEGRTKFQSDLRNLAGNAREAALARARAMCVELQKTGVAIDQALSAFEERLEEWEQASPTIADKAGDLVTGGVNMATDHFQQSVKGAGEVARTLADYYSNPKTSTAAKIGGGAAAVGIAIGLGYLFKKMAGPPAVPGAKTPWGRRLLTFLGITALGSVGMRLLGSTIPDKNTQQSTSVGNPETPPVAAPTTAPSNAAQPAHMALEERVSAEQQETPVQYSFSDSPPRMHVGSGNYAIDLPGLPDVKMRYDPVRGLVLNQKYFFGLRNLEKGVVPQTQLESIARQLSTDPSKSEQFVPLHLHTTQGGMQQYQLHFTKLSQLASQDSSRQA